MIRCKFFISSILFLCMTSIVRPAVADLEINSWTMFMVPIFSAVTNSSGGLTLCLVNSTMPHFVASASSGYGLENRDGKKRLICTRASLRYDSDQNDGSLRIQRNGYIPFNPVGCCTHAICLVSQLPLASETYTQWIWYNNSCKQVVQFTQPINWIDSSYSLIKMTPKLVGQLFV